MIATLLSSGAVVAVVSMGRHATRRRLPCPGWPGAQRHPLGPPGMWSRTTMVRPELPAPSRKARVRPMKRPLLVPILLASLAAAGSQSPDQNRPTGQLQIDATAVDKN